MKIITIKDWINEPLQSANTGDTKQWAKKVKAERNARIEKLCEALGCHYATISNYANGRYIPSPSNRAKIAEVIQRDVLFKNAFETNIIAYYHGKPETN
jgi:transcriptional regulator with XRE-family HTH domain